MEKHSHNIHTFLFLRSICFGSQNMIVRFSVTWHHSHRNWTFVHCHYGWIDKKDNSEFSTAGINKTDNVMILKHWLGAGRQEECLFFAWFCIFHACNTASQGVFHTYTAIVIIYPIKDAGIGNIPEVLIISASSFFPQEWYIPLGPEFITLLWSSGSGSSNSDDPTSPTQADDHSKQCLSSYQMELVRVGSKCIL